MKTYYKLKVWYTWKFKGYKLAEEYAKAHRAPILKRMWWKLKEKNELRMTNRDIREYLDIEKVVWGNEV